MLTLNDGRSELWQWDTGRKLTVDADCTQVHFSNKFFGRSVDVDVVDGVAEIPDVLLQVDKELLVWAFVGTAENGYTKISKVFKVNKRNKPADYVFTPTEQTTLDEIMERLDRIEEGQDPDAIKNAVDEYLANNPIQIEEEDPTIPSWAKQPVKPKYTAKEVGAVATVNGIAPDENGNVKITIPDSSQNVNLLDVQTILRNIMVIIRAQVEDTAGTPQAYNIDVSGLAAECDALISNLSGGNTPDEPDEPVIPDEPDVPDKTLVSISAAYSGGDVPVGTAVSALTGIMVTAHYSDGTSENVTGYTLSGSIAEGENTVTVSYGGKTTTFTVTGMAESGGDAVNLYSGQYLKSANIDQHSENGNAFTYTPAQNGSSITYTIEGLEADKEYTIFVESTRIDGGAKYTQVSVNTGSAASYDGKLVSLYPSWAGAGKNYATFTANGKTMYLWCTETGGSVAGQTVTLTVYIYPGTLTEKP